MFKTYVFLDFETTGLFEPSVTEFCVLAIDRVYPERIRNKLVMCCAPSKPIEPRAAQLTNIENEMVVGKIDFKKEGIALLSLFLQALPAPICMLAHNGDNFDFKIFSEAIKDMRVNLDLYLIDTLPLFREIDREKEGRSYPLNNLSSVHERLFGVDPAVKAHGAEVDCETLVKCFLKLECIEYIEATFELT